MIPSAEKIARACAMGTDGDLRQTLDDAESALRNSAEAEDKIRGRRALRAQKEEESLEPHLTLPTERAKLEAQKRRAVPLFLMCIVLVTGSFLLNLWSLSMVPSELVRLVLSLGLALGTVAFVDVSLDSWADQKYLLFSLASCSSVMMLTTEWLLAKMRVQILIASLQSTMVVSIDGAESAGGSDDPLVKAVLPLLVVCMPLLSVAWELGLSLTWYRVSRALWQPDLILWDKSKSLSDEKDMHYSEGERFRALRADVKSGVMAIHTTVTARRHLFKRIVSVVVPVLLLILLIVLLGTVARASETSATSTVNTIFLLDCSASRPPVEITKDHEFVKRSLGMATPGSRQIIVLITPDSWQESQLLLDGRVGDDPGMLGQNLRLARQKLQDAFERKIGSARCGYHGTDVVGAILYAQQMLSSSPGRSARWYLLSDMRQTQGTNLEHLGAQQIVGLSPRTFPIPMLRGETVFVLGAQTSGSTPSYWKALQYFWISYFRESGASLRGFFVTRDLQAVVSPDSFPVLIQEKLVEIPENSKSINRPERRYEAGEPLKDLAPQFLRIVSPISGVDCNYELTVEGTGTGSGDSIWIIVRSVGINEYWPNKAQINGRGWTGQIVCGRPHQDIGVRYQVMAVANPTEHLEHGVPIGTWPMAEKTSQMIEVIRK